MKAFEDHRDARLQAELRNVPLPAGLFARLREIAHEPDDALDAALTDVPIAPGLLKRIKAVARSDAFDEAVRSATVEEDMPARPGERYVSVAEEIDAQLRDVPLPDRLGDLLRRSVPRRQAPVAWKPYAFVGWAAAAVLMVGLVWSFYAATAELLGTAHHAERMMAASKLQQQPQLEVELLGDAADSQGEAPLPWADIDTLAEMDAQDIGLPSDRLPTESPPANVGSPASVPEPRDRLEPLLGRGFDPPLNGAIQRRESRRPSLAGQMPELESVRPVVPRGVAPPRVKEFDWRAWIRDGVHPFVQPEDHGELTTLRVPLITRTDSYDQAWRSLRSGRLPEEKAIRTEEFLARMNYEFPPPEREALAVRVVAGPSPFGEAGMQLLLVGVQAADRRASGDADADSQSVAKAARLTVKFNPEAVARYRLLGHEADALGGLISGPLEAEFRSGQSAVALFELELKSNANDDVAAAELLWIDAASGERRRGGPLRISRLQFASSTLASPLALLRAAVAAEAAELLRRSPFATNRARGLAEVLDFSRHLLPRARDEASVREMLALVELARRVKLGRPIPPADAGTSSSAGRR